MGNTLGLADPKKIKKFDAFLAKYPKLLNRESLSENKLFKTYSFLVEGESNIIMKVYLKKDSMYLRKHEVSLNYMQKIFNLNIYPNLLPYTNLIDELDFAALVRPKVSLTLSERIETVPAMRNIEKLWIIFQLLTGLYNLHQLELYHGAISPNNVLLTTWQHVFLADFSWFAPNYFYADDLGNISYYHPTVMEKRCYLAPEKLIPRDFKDVNSLQWTHEDITKISSETLVNLQKMDIFSLGCVIAEIMLDGTSLFTIQSLVAYRRGEYSPKDKLDRIRDERIRRIVSDMIQKDPAARRESLDILKEWATQIIPLSFSQLTYYINSSLLSQNFVLPDQRIALIRELLEPIYRIIIDVEVRPHYEPLPISIQQNQILQHFLRYYQMIKPNFSNLLSIPKPALFKNEVIASEKLEARENIDAKELKVLMTMTRVREESKEILEHIDEEKREKNTDLLLIALMVCSNIRNVRYFSSLLVGLEILKNFSYFFTDQINLHFIIPYLLRLLDEQNPKIVVSTFHVICDILSRMTKPIQYKSDKQIFEDQIYPNLLKAYTLNDVEAKTAFVSRIPQIINIGSVFITENFIFDYQIKKNEVEVQDEVQPIPGDVQAKDIDEHEVLESQGESEVKLKKDIDKEVEKWKLTFIPYIQEIFSSNQQEMNEALLRNFAKLGEALGPEFTENILIPHLIAALNDNRFKLISLEEIEKLIDFLSEKTINGLLKPVLEKCMFDSDEMNVFQSVKNLNKTVKLGKLDLRDTSFLIRNFLPLTIHPNSWIREQVLELFCGVIEQLDITELYVNLQPALLKYVKKYEDLALLNAQLFRLVIVDPISRRVFEELRTKGTFNSVKEAQIIDLCAILNEHFLGNISHEMDFEMRKPAPSKGLRKFVDPKVIKNIEEVITDFCTQANLKNIKELTQFENSTKLAKSILDESDKDKNNPFSLEVRTDHLKNASHLRDLRNQLSYKIPELLTQHNIAYSTYIKNVHHFHLFSANILRKRAQLQKRKDKDMGYHERYERVTHLNKEWEPQGFLVKTIYEHNDSVNCLDISYNSKLFASASDGGEIKVFDIGKMESDFTCNSICTLNIKNEKNQEEFGSRSKIKTLKFLDEESFVFGTSTGIIEHHSLQEAGERIKGKKAQAIRQWEVDGEVKSIQPLLLGGNVSEKCFVYATHKGELGIQDVKEKNVSVKFNLGKERGMISAMLTSALDYTVLIGTQRGYVMLYDLRANLLTSMYQLSNEAPILSFANYYPVSVGTPVNSSDALIGISFGSDHHEVGFWNFSDFNKVAKNPEMYIYSSLSAATECSPSYLKDLTKTESIFNIKNSFSERKYYDYLAINSSIYNVLSYFGDSINHSQDMQREKWLSQSRNIYSHMSRAFQYRNSVHKIVSLPNFSPAELRNKTVPTKEMQNILITAGNDMNLRYWNMSTEKYYQISNVDGKKRSYNLTNTDMLIYQEVPSLDPEKTGFSNYQNKNGYSLSMTAATDKNFLAQAGHKDVINDVVVSERYEMLITCSKDKTIKIWK